MKQIKIDYFYIETDEKTKATLYAVEKVEGSIQAPPRLFRFLAQDAIGDSQPIDIEEVNYR